MDFNMKNFIVLIAVILTGSFLYAGVDISTDQQNDTIKKIEKLLKVKNYNIVDKNNNLKSTNCFCKAGCAYGSGDSFHYSKTYDVSCSLSNDEKKKVVAHEMISHFLDEHGLDAVSEINRTVEIRCYTANN